MSSEGKYSEVFSIAMRLRMNVVALQQMSRLVFAWQAVSTVLPLSAFGVVAITLSQFLLMKPDSVLLIACAVFSVFYFVCFFKETHTYSRLQVQYNDVMKQCGELSDMVDWTTMRKRQIYKALDPRIQESIDSFFTYSQSRNCPFHGGRKRYVLGQMVSLAMLWLVFLFSIFVSLGIIHL